MEPSSAFEAGQSVGKLMIYLTIAMALLGGGAFFIIATIKAFKRKTGGWIAASVIAGMVALFGLFGAIGIAANAVAGSIKAAKNASERKKRIDSDDGRYRLEVPGDWKSMPELNEAAGLAAGNEFKELYVLVIENPKTDFAGDLAEFEELGASMIEGGLEKPELGETEPREVGGFPALQRRITGVSDNIRIVYWMNSVETSDAFFQILAWTTPSREANAAPLFEEVFESFRTTAASAVPEAEAADTRTRLKRIVAEVLGSDPTAMTPDSSFVEDLGADSLDTVELVMAIEEEFDVMIADEDVEKLATIDQVAEWLDGR